MNLNNRSLFLDRLQSQMELVKIIRKYMKDKEFFLFPDFAAVTEKESSTLFLSVYSSLLFY